jgi:hypothetical protein
MATSDAQKLFVAGLPDSVTEEVLRGLFTESGCAAAKAAPGSSVTALAPPPSRLRTLATQTSAVPAPPLVIAIDPDSAMPLSAIAARPEAAASVRLAPLSK